MKINLPLKKPKTAYAQPAHSQELTTTDTRSRQSSSLDTASMQQTLGNQMVEQAWHRQLNSPSETTLANSEDINELLTGKKIKVGGEEHRLYFKDTEQGLVPMVASIPQAFTNYLDQLKALRPSSPVIAEFIARYERFQTNMNRQAQMLARDGGGHPEKYHYSNPVVDSFNLMLQAAAADFAANGAQFPAPNRLATGFYRGNVPTTPDLNDAIHLGYETFAAADGVTYAGTRGVNYPIVSIRGNAGTIAGANPRNDHPSGGITNLLRKLSGKDKSWDAMHSRYGQNQAYTKGHLLNHLLHGSGDDWRNLALISSRLNSDTAYLYSSVESWAKDQVNSYNGVISYRVDVVYGRTDFTGCYESFLPRSLNYTLVKKDLVPGAVDPSDATQWAASGVTKIQSYPCTLAYDRNNGLVIRGDAEDPVERARLLDQARTFSTNFASLGSTAKSLPDVIKAEEACNAIAINHGYFNNGRRFSLIAASTYGQRQELVDDVQNLITRAEADIARQRAADEDAFDDALIAALDAQDASSSHATSATITTSTTTTDTTPASAAAASPSVSSDAILATLATTTTDTSMAAAATSVDSAGHKRRRRGDLTTPDSRSSHAASATTTTSTTTTDTTPASAAAASSSVHSDAASATTTASTTATDTSMAAAATTVARAGHKRRRSADLTTPDSQGDSDDNSA